jgi:hypothetical protein
MKCWFEDSQLEDDADDIEAFDAGTAAEIYAQDHHQDKDYADTMIVCVRDHDEVRKFDVVAEQTVEFRAEEVEP